jgi:hypothetical protein
MKCSCDKVLFYPARVRAEVDNYTRIVTFRTGHVCERPLGSPNSHGRHGVDMLWVLSDQSGAVEFIVYTGWMPDGQHSEVLPAAIGYHSPKPMYEDQLSQGPCLWLGGRECYSDGSASAASDVFRILTTRGEEALWQHLETYHKEHFA